MYIHQRSKKPGKLGAEFRPDQDMKVHPPQRNQERAFVQEVFWDHSVSQKALALKLTNPEVLLMTVGIYMPRPGAWGHTLIGTGIGKDS